MVIDFHRPSILEVIRPYPKARLGQSQEQAYAEFINEKERTLNREINPDLLFEVIHNPCGQKHFLNYDPELEPEKFHCKCESQIIPPRSRRWICDSNHTFIEADGMRRPTCPDCLRIQATETRAEKERAKQIRKENNPSPSIRQLEENVRNAQRKARIDEQKQAYLLALKEFEASKEDAKSAT